MTKSDKWIITDDGIDASKGMLAPTYFIENDTLLDKRPGTDLYDWPLQIGGKAFISEDDAQDFVRVWQEAVLKAGLALDEQIVSNTLAELAEDFTRKRKWQQERKEKGDEPSFLIRGRV